MRALDILRKKRDGRALSAAEIDAFVQGATHNTWPDYQITALLMAIYLRGMTVEETAHLTASMVASGKKLDWSDLPGPKVDKHSTGGVGDKTSLILAPLAAACGVYVPMMSGRGLGHTGGTLDKLDAIPGFRHQLGVDELRKVLTHVGFAMIGQTQDVAPADKKLYALRDVTGSVESVPLITASILSKKIAEGIEGLVLDVKCGTGAFMKTLADAELLARSLVSTGAANGVRTRALITDMNAPLGCAVGNALEVKEALAVLRGEGPADLEKLSVRLAAEMLLVAGTSVNLEHAESRIRTALASGQGLERFRAMVEAQGGDVSTIDHPDRLPSVTNRRQVLAEEAGFVTRVNAMLIGEGVKLLGAGRFQADDPVDPAVGCVLRAIPGQKVETGDVLVELHFREESHLYSALPFFELAFQIASLPPREHDTIFMEIQSG